MKKVLFEQLWCGSDCTGPYRVSILAEKMTVREFIEDILTNHKSEWGTIGIYNKRDTISGYPYMEYSHGEEKSHMPEEYLDKVILKATGSGGWSCSDFILHLVEED